MALLVSFLLLGVAFAVAFASFALGRYLAGSAFRVAHRVLPFGEALPSGFEAARPGARVAITLAGPLAVYLFAAMVCTAGFLLGARYAASTDEMTTILQLVSGGQAEAAGLRIGDRIMSVDGMPMRRGEDLRAALVSRPDGPVQVLVQRDGRAMPFPVVPGPGRMIGVRLGPSRDRRSLGDAIRTGMAYPYRLLAGGVAALIGGVQAEVVGPIGIATTTASAPGFGERLVLVGSVESIGIVFFLLGSIALWPPRARRPAAPALSSEVPAPAGDAAWGNAAPARPGLRLVARLIDWLLVFLLIALALPRAAVLLSFLWFPVEALLLSRWGFTPGKWLLRIAVRDREGRRLAFREAFRRSALVWAYGVGADTPFGLATAVLAYDGLKRKGTTYWDTVGGYEVHHLPVGAARAVAAALLVVLGVAAVAASVLSAS